MSDRISKSAPISTRTIEPAETSDHPPENARPVPGVSARDVKELTAEQELTDLGKAARAPALHGRLGLKAGLDNLEGLLDLAMQLHGTKPASKP